MNSRLRPKDRTADENQLVPKTTVNLTTNKSNRFVATPTKNESTTVVSSRLRPQHPVMNSSRSTIGSKGLLSPNRNR